MKCLRIILLSWLVALSASAQPEVSLLPQRHYPKTIPAGDYSGIAWLGGDHYAVVSDKPDSDGFFLFEIKVDRETGEITGARNEGFRSSDQPARDEEGIAYDSLRQRIWISGEGNNQIREYTTDGRLVSLGQTNNGLYAFPFAPGQIYLVKIGNNTCKVCAL